MYTWNKETMQPLVQWCWVVSETNPGVSATSDELGQAKALSTLPCQCFTLIWTFLSFHLSYSLLLGLCMAVFVSFSSIFFRFFLLFLHLAMPDYSLPVLQSLSIYLHILSLMWLKSSSFSASEPRATRSEVEWGQRPEWSWVKGARGSARKAGWKTQRWQSNMWLC